MTTPLQEKMIIAIAEDLYTELNGARPETWEQARTWAEMIIETPQQKGVFTSLMNAELVFHDDYGKDSICGLTEKGFEVYNLLKDTM